MNWIRATAGNVLAAGCGIGATWLVWSAACSLVRLQLVSGTAGPIGKVMMIIAAAWWGWQAAIDGPFEVTK